MNFNIDPNDEKKLRRFLASSEMPELAFSYPELCGYLFGLSIIPEVIDLEEWLADICAGTVPHFDNDREFQLVMKAMVRVVERYKNTLEKGLFSLPFSCAPQDDEEFIEIIDWVAGMDDALSLRPEIWDEYEWMDEMELENLTNALIIFDGIIFPDDAVGVFDDFSETELMETGLFTATDDNEKIIQIQLFMMNALDVAVTCLLEHAARYQEMELDGPCHETVEKNSSPMTGTKKKKGSVIKVDFAGKRKISS